LMPYAKILELDNEIQAGFFDAILNDEGIPHLLVSYRDPAYSTIFQAVRGWGHVEAPESYRSQIEQIFDDLQRAETVPDDDSDNDGPFND
ncbi:MAG TPA: hypothetical protein VMW87_15605, partial [Spirochaetia bacterium]|nr:hypothetical protein [Spirochaetia bacterium]